MGHLLKVYSPSPFPSPPEVRKEMKRVPLYIFSK
jgi:hypothetical protein